MIFNQSGDCILNCIMHNFIKSLCLKIYLMASEHLQKMQLRFLPYHQVTNTRYSSEAAWTTAITEHECVGHLLQSFQWLVLLQCNSQGYGSTLSQTVVVEAAVKNNRLWIHSPSCLTGCPRKQDHCINMQLCRSLNIYLSVFKLWFTLRVSARPVVPLFPISLSPRL